MEIVQSPGSQVGHGSEDQGQLDLPSRLTPSADPQAPRVDAPIDQFSGRGEGAQNEELPEINSEYAD